MDKNDVRAGEWSEAKKWNPFNSYKLLAHVYRWRLIERGSRIPQPVLVTVDPVNRCNLNCTWCNSGSILKRGNRSISRQQLLDIADFLSEWKAHDRWEKGVESICIAGGGEPLLHPDIGEFIERCIHNGIRVGVVTNGTRVDRWIEPLSQCTWVGISMDAGSAKTFKRIKGRDRFDSVIRNMETLITYSKDHNTRLARSGQGYGVSYKFLLHPENMNDVSDAAGLAKSVGCRNFHLRPAGIPWNRVQEATSFFSDDGQVPERLRKQMDQARELETHEFGVFGITHKFDRALNTHNRFKRCHAIFMTAVFMPASSNNADRFDLGLCCDRRGDDSLVLCNDLEHPEDILSAWGSPAHWAIFDKIRIATCPRCTYQPHNQLFEKVILEDNMTYRFI